MTNTKQTTGKNNNDNDNENNSNINHNKHKHLNNNRSNRNRNNNHNNDHNNRKITAHPVPESLRFPMTCADWLSHQHTPEIIKERERWKTVEMTKRTAYANHSGRPSCPSGHQ